MNIQNGYLPEHLVPLILASGNEPDGSIWEFRASPMFARCWAAAKAYAEEHFGRTLYIRTGWNVYRPYRIQVKARIDACASGNCLGASSPGGSSHGGIWQGRPCLAVDVDPNGLTWDQVDEAMESAGFSARLITEKMSGIPGGERWHYILFTALDPVPAGEASYTEEEVMSALTVGTVINVVKKNGDRQDSGTLWIACADGTFKPYPKPYAPNIRGILTVLAGTGAGTEDKIPTFNEADASAIFRVWRIAVTGQ